MDSTVRPAIDIGVESTSLVPPRHSSSNAYSGESSWSQMFKSGSALDRAFSRFSRKANTTLPTSIDFSTSHEPLEILQSLLDTLRKSQIPGPQLIRLRQEFNQIIGHGAQCDVLGASADAERLLRTAVLEESDSRTAAALQTYKLIAIKRTRALGDPSEVATSQGNGTRGIRDQFISAQKDINALCHGPFRRHPNIVNLHAWGLCLDTLEDPSGESPSIPLLILERADWNLSEFLQSQRRPTSSEFNVQQLRRICLDIGKGLEAIHKENMTHGDLKPDNVLVFLTQGRCIAKLCDFGLAAAEKKGDEALAEYRGTPGWRPPEASRTLSSASLVLCDVFAYGLVVWCVATLDWRSPVSESEDFGEKEIYYHAWKGVQDASVIPSGEEWNRILRVLRGSLHAAPRLRERQPWHYLDEKQFRIIGSVYDPTQDSASLLVFDLLMKVTEWASNRIDKMSKEIDTGGLDMFLSSVSISGSLNGRLRSYFAVILGALYKLGSLGMRMWGSKPTLDRQTVYEKWFIQYQTSLGSSISMDLDGITPFPHPLDYCLNIRSLKGDLHWKCLSIQQHDSNYNDTTRLIGLPGAVEDDIYALARLRSRFQLCSWEESDAILRSHDPSYSGSDVNILAEALSRIADSAILAWLCRGPIGRAEFEKCPKEVLWRSTYDRGFTRVQRLERVVLLLEMGAHVEDQVSVTEAPTSAFGRILQALVDDGPTSAQSEIPVTVCKQFKRMICNSGGLSQARFFMTGELPDQEDIDVAGGFSTTALHEAVLARCYPAVEFLLCLKFPVHVLNRNRQTPFQLAKTLAQDTTEPHQKLQSLRILALMKQKVGESDEKADLPIGWAAKKLTLGHYVYTEFYTNSITFKIPKFSLFEDRRLALGFRRITALGQTYCIDLIRFLTYDNPEADYGCLTESTTYNEAWFTKNVEETKTQLLETPTWIKFSYGLARSTSMVVWFILANSYLNLLLIFLPLSITAHLANWDYRPSLALNTLALVALCSLFDFSMQQISMRFGETGRSLAMGASESMIELLVGLVALYCGEVRLVKSIVIGVVVNNTFLILGLCFAAAGVRYHEVSFNKIAASTMHELLAVATMFLVVIYMFDFRASRSAHDTSGDLIILTYAISVIMPILYILHNFFRFRTHADLHAEEREDYEHEEDGLQPFPDGHEIEIIPTIPACITALLTLASMTACVIYLVTNVSEASHSLAVPVGTFLVPVGLKISVHFTAIRNAYNNKMDRALTSVVGGTLRTIFLLAPIFVFFGLIIHQPMTLLFDQLQVVVVALAMWLISPVMASGTSTFLNGAQLLLVYIIFCFLYFFYMQLQGG